MPATPAFPVVSLRQVENILGLSRHRIRAAMNAGAFPPPATTTPGGFPRWRSADILRFQRCGGIWPPPPDALGASSSMEHGGQE